MNKTELCGRVRRSAEAMGIALPEAAPEQFYLYYQMIEEANGRMNLTRVLEPEEAVDRHFMDWPWAGRTGPRRCATWARAPGSRASPWPSPGPGCGWC